MMQQCPGRSSRLHLGHGHRTREPPRVPPAADAHVAPLPAADAEDPVAAQAPRYGSGDCSRIPCGRPESAGVLRGDRPADSTEDAADLVRICDVAIAEYKAKRGRAIWEHRAPGLGQVPGKDRYETLKRAGFRCELCGVSAEETCARCRSHPAAEAWRPEYPGEPSGSLLAV